MADSKTKFKLVESHEAMDLVPTWELQWWWIALLVFFLAVLVLLVIVILKKAKVYDSSNLKREAFQRAMAELDKLDESLGKENVIMVSLVLRKYLAKVMKEPALYETHEEFIGRHDAIKGFNEELKVAISEYFSKLAALKYGPDEGVVSDVELLKRGAVNMLERIHSS
jgi:ABC-type multidrug transport system fused ATPase/permease subunit